MKSFSPTIPALYPMPSMGTWWWPEVTNGGPLPGNRPGNGLQCCTGGGLRQTTGATLRKYSYASQISSSLIDVHISKPCNATTTSGFIEQVNSQWSAHGIY